MMSDKLTPKQETFARHVAEGDTYAAAYRKAYSADNMSDAVIRNEASKLMSNRDISVTVMELQEAASERSITNIIGQTVRLKELSTSAETEQQYAASIGAEKEINKLHGLYEKDNKQKAESNEPGLNDWEVARRIAFILRKGQEERSDANGQLVVKKAVL